MAQNDAMKVWRYPIGAQESNVCFWHKADMLIVPANVRFRG
jgi:hypothetical protein